jgi:ubiquitin C-terminal hydrolase
LCQKCKRKSKATKQILIHTLPNILVLQLKCFNFLGTHGFKLSEHIAFDMQLDMSPFLSREPLGGAARQEAFTIFMGFWCTAARLRRAGTTAHLSSTSTISG